MKKFKEIKNKIKRVKNRNKMAEDMTDILVMFESAYKLMKYADAAHSEVVKKAWHRAAMEDMEEGLDKAVKFERHYIY